MNKLSQNFGVDVHYFFFQEQCVCDLALLFLFLFEIEYLQWLCWLEPKLIFLLYRSLGLELGYACILIYVNVAKLVPSKYLVCMPRSKLEIGRHFWYFGSISQISYRVSHQSVSLVFNMFSWDLASTAKKFFHLLFRSAVHLTVNYFYQREKQSVLDLPKRWHACVHYG